MDILSVLLGKYESEMNEHFYEINSILKYPLKENSLNDLNKSVRSYCLLKNQADMLKDIKGQMQAMDAKQAQDNRYNED